MKSRMLVFATLALTSYVSIALAEPSPKALSPAILNRTVTATLPDSQHIFPPGAGAEIANSQCMICHSAGMVTRQPALSISVWKGELIKMRTAYGAPMPEEQVDALAKYLATINGKP